MAQQIGPNAPNQVVFIIQAPKEKMNLKDVYNIKAAKALGIIHIICGFITLVAEIGSLMSGDYFTVGNGIWTSVIFFVSGGLAIGGARHSK